MTKNFPWTSVATLAILVAAVVVLSVIRAQTNGEIITILVGLIPGILAAGYAERTNRDVRNGVVQQKAKEGATQALQETGVTAVVSSAADNTRAYMETLNAHTSALTQLLASHENITADSNAAKTKEGA